ncbi:MAG: hypothetical protein ACK41O_07815, partial [Runella zeae]
CAIGNTQRFGVPMGYGGPHAAYFATRDEFKRVIPGRIIGVSVDRHGNKALRMALQTREQHIRREKATSNICTAQALLAIMAGMYAVYHGEEGIKNIALKVHGLACVLHNALQNAGYKVLQNDFFDTIAIQADAQTESLRKYAEDAAMNFNFNTPGFITISVDETTELDDIKDIIAVFSRASGTSSTQPLELENIEMQIGAAFLRTDKSLTHPIFNMYHSESEMMRYLKSLENKDLSLNTSMISLGSCTMKLNAATELIPVSWPEFSKLHPFTPASQTEGYRQIITELENYLSTITGFAATSLVYAVGVFFLLRLLIKQNRFHFSGIDNALIYGIIGATLPAVFEIYSGLKLTSAWSGVALIMPILVAMVYIFGEPLVAVGMLGSGLFIIASWLVQTAWGKALLPFALMLVTGGLYGAIRWFVQKPSSFYWQTALEWLRIASLVVFYLAGNYGFVREANAQLNGLSSPAPEISFAAIFWLLTFGVPALYLYGGIKQRDRSLLFLGSVAVVCSVITLHQYHPFLSVEWMMIGGGLLLVGSTYRLIKGLKQPKAGFVSVADAEQEERVGLEAVVLAQLTQQTQNADHGVRLGGGDFGGGGAGDQY